MKPASDTAAQMGHHACPQGSYEFDITTLWRFDAWPEELTAIVLDPELIHRWCPSVFMHGELVERGGPDGVGITIRLHTKGFLPHSFFFVARIVEIVPHRFMRIAVSGDFDGVGEISVAPHDPGGCEARLRWRTSVPHPYVRRFVRLLHPVFVWNHKWAMRRAGRLLQAEVERRRSASGRFTREKATFPHSLAAFRDWQRHRAARRGWEA